MFESYFNDRFFDRFSSYPTPIHRFDLESDFRPAVDLKESKEGFTLKADVPGFKKEDLKIRHHNNILTIEGERANETKDGDEDSKFHRVERSYGKFVRAFSLPQNANFDSMKAKYNEGVLEIKIQKLEEEEKEEEEKQVEIES